MSRAPFAGLRPPAPPPDLRARVLAATREALAGSPAGSPAGSLVGAPVKGRPALLDRLWLSRTARVAWLATVLFLAAANLLVWRGSPDRGAAAWRAAARARPAAIEPALAGWRAILERPRHSPTTWSERWSGGRLPEESETRRAR